MEKLNIYKIDLDYINYLKEFEPNICHPKDFGYTRPYIGILAFETSDFYYFAPLTSQTNKPEFYCVKLFNSEKQPIGGVRINNMIPISKDNSKCFKLFEYHKLLTSKNSRDVKYGNLIKQEVACLSALEVNVVIRQKAKFFYRYYKENKNVNKISNNFKLLEEKALKYEPKKEKEQSKGPELSM